MFLTLQRRVIFMEMFSTSNEKTFLQLWSFFKMVDTTYIVIFRSKYTHNNVLPITKRLTH